MTKRLRPVMNLWSVEQLISPKFVAVFAALFFVAGISWTSAQAQNGNLVWAKRAGGGLTELGLGIAVDGAGNSYATGYFQTGAVFGPGEANQVTLTASGGSDIYIAKYGPDGAFAWDRWGERRAT